MEDLFQQAGHIIINLGFPGIVIAAMAYVIRDLYSHLIALYEKRVAENQALITAINVNTNVLEKLTEALAKQVSK